MRFIMSTGGAFYASLLEKKLNFSQKLILIFKKGYQLKNFLLFLCLYTSLESLFLTPLSIAFEKVCEGIFDPYF